jgi:kumamolisin
MANVKLAATARTLEVNSSIIGKADPKREIQVTVHVKPANDPENQKLTAFLVGSSAQNGQPSSPGLTQQSVRERRHLSREEFAATYGITPADVSKVRKFAHEHGFRVVRDVVARETGANPLGYRTVELRGTIGALSRAFKVKLLKVRDAQGRIYRVQEGAVSIPAEYDDVIENVLGLDTRPQAFPRLRSSTRLGGFDPQVGLPAFTPDQVAKLYNFPNGFTGKGQTIALLELGGGARVRDLRTYFNSLGLPQPSVNFVGVGAGSNSPTGNPDGDDGEVMLDIEVAGAVAPGAEIVVYFGRNNNRGFFRAINAAVHDSIHKPSIISISWGGPEGTYTQADLKSFDEAFQAAAAMGISVFVAAGDSGLTDGVSGRTAHVDFPGSSPFVTACGGTRLIADSSGGAISSEVVWNDGAAGGGTGGGISAVFPPPFYQQSVTLPPSVNPGSKQGRGVPDVAGNADPQTGYKVRVDGVNTVVGGTSAVAPLWAGLFALVNEALGQSAGFANSIIYSTAVAAVKGTLRDITQGNNDTTGQFAGKYAAVPGWDACTGLGTPNGTPLVTAIKSA